MYLTLMYLLELPLMICFCIYKLYHSRIDLTSDVLPTVIKALNKYAPPYISDIFSTVLGKIEGVE